jgi:tRNA(fMet)-specific endonuclease VapC
MVLLDTDVISNLMRSAPPATLIRRFATLAPDAAFTSAISVSELVYGAHRSSRTGEILRRLEERVWPNVTVLPFDRDAAEVHGRVRAALEREGPPLPEPDLRIAAIALARSLTLITSNIRRFGRVPGLRVEDWIAD